MTIELLLHCAATGLGATLIMDLWGLLLHYVFGSPAPNYCLVGRWLSHMPDGVFKHPGISRAAAKPFECAIGWLAHYAIGMTFAITLVILATPRWLQAPSVAPALAFGIVTVVFPYFVMQPAFGLGRASSRAPNPFQARLRSLLNHTVFGLGLYAAAIVLHHVTAADAA